MTYILGINGAYHELSACLVHNGKLLACAEEERFNRVKHAKSAKTNNSNTLPWKAIEYCLSVAPELKGIEGVNHIGFSLLPNKRLEQNTQHYHPYMPTLKDFGTEAGEKLFFNTLQTIPEKFYNLGFKGRFHFLEHHKCHAASVYNVSPFKEAATLVIDGIGEFETTSLFYGTTRDLRHIWSLDYPNSLGFLWEKMAQFLGFSEYDAAKVMGLSSYGDASKFLEPMEKLLTIKSDTFYVNDTIAEFRRSNMTNISGLFDLPPLNEAMQTVNQYTQCYADLAAALQKQTEKAFVMLARKAQKTTNSKNLCLAGGVMLNCVANTELLNQSSFDRVFIQPAANDAGTAIGAAYLIHNEILEEPRTYVLNTPYLGPEFSNKDIQDALDMAKLTYQMHSNITEMVANLIFDNHIVGWFQGRMEIGPRALGNRSILANPCSQDIQDILNHKVKHREAFRPFSPSILEDKAHEWFMLNENDINLRKNMLAVSQVISSKKENIPAVVHVDGTSRVQLVCEKINPKYYDLIKQFEYKSSVPILLNTSFNDNEPIVCTPQDAINTFLKTHIDYLAIGDYLVSRTENSIL